MRKFSVLLVLAGLAVGLWLGFNPAAHKEVVRLWNGTTTSQTGGTPRAFLPLRQLNSKVSVWLRSTGNVQTAPKSRPATPVIWTQISAALQAFWHALQRLWLSFVAKINRIAL